MDLRHHGDADAEPGLLDFAVNVRGGCPPDWLRVSVGTPADMAAFRDAMPAGSFLVLSIGINDVAPDVAQDFIKTYSAAQVHQHSREQITGYFAGLEIVEPGLTEARSWRQDQPQADAAPRPADALACVGRKAPIT